MSVVTFCSCKGNFGLLLVNWRYALAHVDCRGTIPYFTLQCRSPYPGDLDLIPAESMMTLE